MFVTCVLIFWGCLRDKTICASLCVRSHGCINPVWNHKNYISLKKRYILFTVKSAHDNICLSVWKYSGLFSESSFKAPHLSLWENRTPEKHKWIRAWSIETLKQACPFSAGLFISASRWRSMKMLSDKFPALTHRAAGASTQKIRQEKTTWQKGLRPGSKPNDMRAMAMLRTASSIDLFSRSH